MVLGGIFGHFTGFEVFFVIVQVSGLFWSFKKIFSIFLVVLKFLGYFDHFNGFKDI